MGLVSWGVLLAEGRQASGRVMEPCVAINCCTAAGSSVIYQRHLVLTVGAGPVFYFDKVEATMETSATVPVAGLVKALASPIAVDHEGSVSPS